MQPNTLIDGIKQLVAVISQNVIIIFIILATIIVLYFAYKIIMRLTEEKVSNHHPPPVFSRDVVYLEHEVSSMKAQIYNLNELNTRYLNFSQSLTDVVKQLNASLSFNEIITTITRLINDIINTTIIEIYIPDPETQGKVLMKVEEFGKAIDTNVSYNMGEGLIGMAAHEGMVKVRGRIFNGTSEQSDTKPQEQFSMASPIHFKNNLLGVIGIGNIKNPNGNERTLLKMISDIAGVALVNQKHMTVLGDEAKTDPLTGLYNRRYFEAVAKEHMEKSMREDTLISICMFDIDNFKHYNDTNGHQEGDRLLKAFCDQLITLSRKTTVIARYGGEEFIVLMSDLTKNEAIIYADRVREHIASHPFPHADKQPLGCISVSGGIASFPVDASSIERVIKLADKALYKAKENGRNQVIAHGLSLTSIDDEVSKD